MGAELDNRLREGRQLAAVLLRTAREVLGVARGELAAAAGCAPGLVRRIEAGDLDPAMDTVERILNGSGLELRAGPGPADGLYAGPRANPAEAARVRSSLAAARALRAELGAPASPAATTSWPRTPTPCSSRWTAKCCPSAAPTWPLSCAPRRPPTARRTARSWPCWWPNSRNGKPNAAAAATDAAATTEASACDHPGRKRRSGRYKPDASRSSGTVAPLHRILHSAGGTASEGRGRTRLRAPYWGRAPFTIHSWSQ